MLDYEATETQTTRSDTSDDDMSEGEEDVLAFDLEDPEDDFSMFDAVCLEQSLAESLLRDMDDNVQSTIFRAKHVPDPLLMT